MRARAFALALLAVVGCASAGCSWLIGVSDDPVVVDGPPGSSGDAGDEDAARD